MKQEVRESHENLFFCMFEIPDSMDFFQKKIGCNSKPLINFKFINFCRNVGGNPGIKIISAGLFISAMCQSNSQPQLVNMGK